MIGPAHSLVDNPMIAYFRRAADDRICSDKWANGVWMMRRALQKITTLLAIYAIALHVILSSVGSSLVAPTVDPFSVICHTASPAPAQQKPADPDHEPSSACDHCSLCSAIAPPAVLDDVLVGQFVPTSVLELLRPASSFERISRTATIKLARGPPQTL